MSFTMNSALAGDDRAATYRRWRRQSVQAGIITTMLAAAIWCRHELMTIDEIDLVESCGVPKRHCRIIVEAFELRRDRLAGLIAEPARRRSCRDNGLDEVERSCDAQFAGLSRRFGKSRVRRALQWRYGSAEQIVDYYVSEAFTFACRVAIASSGAAFILLVIKFVNGRDNASPSIQFQNS